MKCYVDTAYCYKRSSVVCWPAMITSPAKMAQTIEMPFGMWTRVGARKHILDAVAHWRHLANVIQPSVCGIDVALSNYVDHLFKLTICNKKNSFIVIYQRHH